MATESPESPVTTSTTNKWTSERVRQEIIAFIGKYQKIMLTSLIAVVAAGVLAAGWAIYQNNRVLMMNTTFEKGFNLYLRSQRTQDAFSANQYVNEAISTLETVEKKVRGTALGNRASYILANCYYQTKKSDEAIKRLKKVSEQRGFYLAPQAMYDLIMITVEAGNYDDALMYAQKFKKMYAKSYLAGEVVITASTVYRKLNDREKAVNVLKEFLKANPESSYKKKMAERVALLEAKVL
ncbi:MAG: tetratricopeptide repeat protein [Spirochaetes bacterium]|nr:tetratricopeptide repeat protein [Spirochaetota bacterium]